MPHIIEPPIDPPPAPLPRIRWTAEKYEALFHAGILSEKGYELIEGDIVEKMPTKDAHAHIITLLFVLFLRFVPAACLRSASTLYINDTSLPEPDFTVLQESPPPLTSRGYAAASSARLLIEVSDATLASDLTTKATLYAQAVIGEYWVVDVSGRRLRIHGQPEAGIYRQITEYTETDTAAPRFDPAQTFAVADVLP